MSIHVDVCGQGENLVLVHGWALHGAVWKDLIGTLAKSYRINCLDLPGHGRSSWRGQQFQTIDELARRLAAVAPQRAHWIGWSLGGMAALAFATQQPERTLSLSLISSTPKFVSSSRVPRWNDGMRPAVFASFVDELQRDWRTGVKRFLTLTARGDQRAREVVRDLRKRVFAFGEPAREALVAGLSVLGQADLRDRLEGLQTATLLLAGQYDRVVPAAASRYMAERIPHARLAQIAKASHAPMLSHRDEVLDIQLDFLSQVNDVTETGNERARA